MVPGGEAWKAQRQASEGVGSSSEEASTKSIHEFPRPVTPLKRRSALPSSSFLEYHVLGCHPCVMVARRRTAWFIHERFGRAMAVAQIVRARGHSAAMAPSIGSQSRMKVEEKERSPSSFFNPSRSRGRNNKTVVDISGSFFFDMDEEQRGVDQVVHGSKNVGPFDPALPMASLPPVVPSHRSMDRGLL